MNRVQIALVQLSFEKILPRKEATAQMFYERLFQLDPSLRPLFKTDLKEQGKKFMDMLELLVGGLLEFDDVVPALREMGERHIKYGAKPAHYWTLQTALLWTLEQVLGDEFTGETRQAWSDVYDLLARAMLKLPSVSGPSS